VNPPTGPVETPDIETASPGYASRFAGPVGTYFLDLQTRSLLSLLDSFPPPGTLLDVGGGHAQVAPALAAQGYTVTVLGSHADCFRHHPELATCHTQVGDVVDLPFPDQTFDIVTSFRLLPHLTAWRRCLTELCRVARRAVVVDYPSIRSVNACSRWLFPLKRRIEGNTRPWTLFHPREIADAFSAEGFALVGARAQFLLPMVLYRMAGSARVARALEWLPHHLGLTRRWGSPIVACAARHPRLPGESTRA